MPQGRVQRAQSHALCSGGQLTGSEAMGTNWNTGGLVWK